MMSSIAPPRPAMSRIWLSSPEAESCRSAGSSSIAGGSRRTDADVTRKPYSLRVSTSSHVTGSAPRTIHPPGPGCRPFGSTAITSPTSAVEAARAWPPRRSRGSARRRRR